MKQEFNNFKTEMNQKLQNISGDVCNQDARLTEAEQRVEELETANTELRDSLLYSLKQQRTFQAKITDLEGHSRRNNIRIYGIKEGKEGPSMLTFINDFLKTKRMLDGSMDLQIQRAHDHSVLSPKTRPSQDPFWLISRDLTSRTRYSKLPGQRKLLMTVKWLCSHTTSLPR